MAECKQEMHKVHSNINSWLKFIPIPAQPGQDWHQKCPYDTFKVPKISQTTLLMPCRAQSSPAQPCLNTKVLIRLFPRSESQPNSTFDVQHQPRNTVQIPLCEIMHLEFVFDRSPCTISKTTRSANMMLFENSKRKARTH